VGKFLKEMNPKVQIVGVDPIGSILHDYFYSGRMTEAHSYKVEGIGEDFIPSVYDFSYIDDIVKVNDKESLLMTRRLVREEGMFVGGSCGAAVAGALRYASERSLGPDKLVVVLLPDSGSRYLSKVFDDNWMRENRFLESDWVDTPVSAILSRKPQQEMVCARSGDSVTAVIDKLKAADVSQLPVIGEREQLVGIVTEVNLLNYLLRTPGMEASQTAIEDAGVIHEHVPTVTPDMPAEVLMSLFTTEKLALVVERTPGSDDRKVIGIITQIDLLDYLARR
jgi:cystathionine beta-synthase